MRTFLLRALQCIPSLLIFSCFLAAQEPKKSATTIIDFEPPVFDPSHLETTPIVIKGVELLSWQGVGSERKQTVFKEFRETKHGHMVPSTKFDVVCEVR
jgi:hypothetical protein